MNEVRTVVWLEALLGLAVVSLLGFQLWHLQTYGYLAQPFFYDTTDTLMDYYHTVFWSHTSAAYTAWTSIYPPFTFALLRLVTPSACYTEDAYIGRDCDPSGWVLSLLAVAAMAWVAWRANEDLPWPARCARVAAVAVGMPTLFGLERGNVFLLAAPALFYGLLRRTDWRGAFLMAMAINLKPYLVVVVLALALCEDWRAAARTLAACAVVYLLSHQIIGNGMPWVVLTNIRNFVGDGVAAYWEKIYYTTSFSPWLRVLDSELALDNYIEGRSLDQIRLAMQVGLAVGQGAFLVGLLCAVMLPKAERPKVLLSVLLLGFLMVQTEAMGGYALILFVGLVLCLPAQEVRGHRGWVLGAVVMAYAQALPYDYVMFRLREWESGVWLTGREIEVVSGVAVGQVARPAVLVVGVLCLAAVLLQRATASPRWQRWRQALAV